MRRLATALVSLAALGACSQADAPEREEPAADTAARTVQPAPDATADPAADGAGFRYTRLDDCTLIRSNPDEAGFFEHECPGEGGYRLRLVESDLRETVTVLAPGGGEHDLALSALADGAFSSVGGVAEWLDTDGGAFTPDSLILRHTVMEDPDPSVPEVSYLVVVRLGADSCVIARIPPGPGQNAAARRRAQAGGPCLTRSG